MSTSLSYPLGKFAFDAEAAPQQRASCIHDIAQLPTLLETAVEGLDDAQLDTPYRPEGWTVRQLVHHVADSHVNAYIRFRLAMTEHEPPAKAYNEKAWAELEDGRHAPIAPSLEILRGVHSRWVTLLRSMQDEDFARTVVHTENGPGTLERYTALYAWHGKHHVEHVLALRKRSNW